MNSHLDIEVLPEESLNDEFKFCESLVEKLMQDITILDKNDQIKNCIIKLQSILKSIDLLSLFSTNDNLEDLPTSSIHYLLAPAYLAYFFEEVSFGIEKREFYLKAAKIHYRQFLENLLIYQIISFKLPWLYENGENEKANSSLLPQKNFENAANKRATKINRLKQKKLLEECLAQLKHERIRNNDEATERKLLLTLISYWAIRAIDSLSQIDEECLILEHMASKNKKKEASDFACSSNNIVKPFIIAKTVAQKKVFGLGYPSIPIYTVDEWFDQMKEKNGFGNFPTYTIDSKNDNLSHSDDDDDDDNSETRRQKKIQSDEWKDDHRRGWGNTYNKG